MDIGNFFKPKKAAKVKKDNTSSPTVTLIGHKEPEQPSSEEMNNEVAKFMIGKYNLYNMTLKPQKKGYQIFVKHKGAIEKIKFTLSWLKSPFGIEEYFHKEILNLEFTNYQKNNHSHNNHALIKQLDDELSNLGKYLNEDSKTENYKYLTIDFLNELNKLHYSPLIKVRPDDYDPLVRVHLKKTGNTIITKCYRKNQSSDVLTQISPYEVKGHMLEVEFELSTIWLTNDSYGIVLVANKLTVL